MNTKQWQWLTEAAGRIPGLFEALKQGHDTADTTLGVRVINGRPVRLSLLVEVVDPGPNPLHSHANVNFPYDPVGKLPPNMATPKPRNPKRAKRCPSGCRVLCDIEVYKLPTIMTQYNEHIKYLKGGCRYCKKCQSRLSPLLDCCEMFATFKRVAYGGGSYILLRWLGTR